MKINAHKSPGIDKISARLLRSSAAAVAPVESSYRAGKLPKSHLYSRVDWSVTLVTFAQYLSSRFCQR